jgi:hypothetical protein
LTCMWHASSARMASSRSRTLAPSCRHGGQGVEREEGWVGGGEQVGRGAQLLDTSGVQDWGPGLAGGGAWASEGRLASNDQGLGGGGRARGRGEQLALVALSCWPHPAPPHSQRRDLPCPPLCPAPSLLACSFQ